MNDADKIKFWEKLRREQKGLTGLPPLGSQPVIPQLGVAEKVAVQGELEHKSNADMSAEKFFAKIGG